MNFFQTVIASNMEGQVDGRYQAHPMVAIGPNIYQAKLTIRNITEGDLDHEHRLQVSHRAPNVNVIEETVSYR